MGLTGREMDGSGSVSCEEASQTLRVWSCSGVLHGRVLVSISNISPILYFYVCNLVFMAFQSYLHVMSKLNKELGPKVIQHYR